MSDPNTAPVHANETPSPPSGDENGQISVWPTLPKAWTAHQWHHFKQDVPKTFRRPENEEPESEESKNPEPENEKPQVASVRPRRMIDNGAIFLVHSRKILSLAKKLSNIDVTLRDNQEQILLSADFLEWLTGTSEENAWKHHDGSGCVVQVRLYSPTDDRKRQVVLTGTARAREITASHLQALETEYRTNHPVQSAKEEEMKSSSVTNVHTRVDQLPQPRTWSLRTFSDYVATIVNSQVSKGIDKVLYSAGPTFNQAVAQTLIKAFEDPTLRPVLSSYALRQALAFISSRTDIAFAASKITLSVTSAGIIPDTECFNHEITRLIKVRNVTSLQRVLNEMVSAHVRPNSTTWAHLLRSMATKEYRTAFLQLPALQDVGHDEVLQEAMMQALVDTAFEPSDENPRSVTAFRHKLQQRLGHSSLTPPIAQSMIEKCVFAKVLQPVSEILKMLGSSPAGLDAASFGTLLKAVADTGWFEDVLTLLKMQFSHGEPPLDRQHIELVFRSAWRQRLVNTARVLWHHAASHGSIRHTMMRKVSQEIAQNVHPAAGASSRLNTWMAAMVVGTDQSLALTRQSTVFSEHDAFLNSIKSLKAWTADGESRHNQMQIAHIVIERDMTAWQRVKPIQHSTLIKLLENAFSLDTEWHSKELILTRPFTELAQQVMSIQLEPVSTTKVAADRLTSPPIVLAQSHHSKSVTVEHVLTSKEVNELVRSDSAHRDDMSKFSSLSSEDVGTRGISSCSLAPVTTTSMLVSNIPLIDLLLHYLGLANEDL